MAEVRQVTFEATQECLKNAVAILWNCRKTLASLLGIFDKPGGKQRQPGNPSDAEQDLLRAMLVFAGAGLDSMLKQMIRDSLTQALGKVKPLKADFIDYNAKRLIKKTTTGEAVDTHLITQYFIEASPKERMISSYSEAKTRSSLQSKAELLKISAALGLEPRQVTSDLAKLEAAFTARNQIVHEMDVDFSVFNRLRRQRRRDDIVELVNHIVETSENILKNYETLLV